MLYITAVRLGGGRSLHHITHVKWLSPDDGKSNQMTVAQTIAWMENNPTTSVKVAGVDGPALVRIVRPQGGTPYIRTSPDNSPTDNLLSLPQF